MTERFYPIGVPGVPWGEAERTAWRAQRPKLRSHADDVVARIDALKERFDVVDYGALEYGEERYPLQALKSRPWNPSLPIVVVTGGVHGYETSGVHGALQFIEQHGDEHKDRMNLLVVPCVSPWGYERINRWTHEALDPNRSFKAGGQATESLAVMKLVSSLLGRVLLHIDLHETTDSDESEFRPAVAARDGKTYTPGTIPDGFYLVDDSVKPQPAFQAAIIAAVEQITHIAPADPDGTMIGTPVVAPGVIEYPVKSLGLCAGMTDARFTTTTEVYPDSPRATPEQCNAAQVAAVRAAIAFALNDEAAGV